MSGLGFQVWSMIRKSGNRFSEKIMLKIKTTVGIGPLAYGKRRVTSGAGGGEPHRLTNMSRTISMLSAITSIVVTMLR
jgi:hypothetical protein